jgi:hypothetical protein
MQTDSEISQATAELEGEQIRMAGNEAMDEIELEGLIAGLIEEAQDHIDLTESPDRVQASDYYMGRPFGNEEDGRSQVVSYDVRDTVSLMLPQIMRTFFGAERVVEFMPRQPEDVQPAEQASDYVNQVVLGQDNPAFSIFYSAFKDALVRRVGVIKIDWERREEVEHEEFSGLDDQALEALLSDPDIEGSSIESYPDPDYVAPPPPPEQQQQIPPGAEGQQVSPGGEQPPQQQMQKAPQLHDVVIRRLTVDGSVTLEALPPEELLIDRRAKSVEDNAIVAHRRYLTVSELTSMGYDYDEMLDLASSEDEFGTNTEFLARNPLGNHTDSENAGEANKKVLYIEAFARIDFDGDGIAELRRFCCAGNHHQLLHHSPVNDLPFVIFNGYPEPHLWRGQSVADLTMDVQLIKSSVLRNMLDSLSKSIHPDTWIVEGQASLDDVTSNKVGKIVRLRAPGMMGELNKSFSGKEAFPMLDYLDQIKEDRTGMSKASMGLNPDALQSSTKAAVSATVSASQAQIELLCRVFAETGMKPLFKKILKLLHTHQDKTRMVRLRNTWTPIDPRVWDANMDVSVNVALGLGTTEERMQMLSGLASKQEAILEKQGTDNPLVNMQQYHATLIKMTELSGYKDTQAFWSDPKNYKPPEPKPPEPTPDEVFAQAQADKVRADIDLDKQKFALEQEKMIRQDDLNRDKLDAELAMKKDELENKYQTTIDQTEIRGILDADRERARQQTLQEQQALQQQQMGAPPMPPVDMNPQQMGPPMEPIPN